jgi:hypothetical protein
MLTGNAPAGILRRTLPNGKSIYPDESIGVNEDGLPFS